MTWENNRESFDTLVIAIDYMQNRSLPHFGSSPQPGKAYYKRRLTVHVLGAVFHRTDEAAVYLTDEMTCPRKDGRESPVFPAVPAVR